MKTFWRVLILSAFTFHNSNAQTFLEPFTGYQRSLNNQPSFAQVNAGIQVAFKTSDRYELLVQLQKNLPLTLEGSDSAFTPNSSLPLFASAQKSIKPSGFSIVLGHRFKVTDHKKAGVLSILLQTGFTTQTIKVNYDYDKSNYTVLNPDRTLSKDGIFIGAGVEYMRTIKTGRLFAQLTVATEPLSRSTDYPSSFNFIAPLALNVGYSFLIKTKHEKKTI